MLFVSRHSLCVVLALFFVAGASLWGAPASTGPIPGIDEIPRAPSAGGTPPVAKENLPTAEPAKEPSKEDPKKEEPPRKEEKKEPSKKEPAKEPTKKEEKKEAQPLISGLKVELDPKSKNTVLITWKVSPDNTTPIYVGRLKDRPIESRDHVLDADNLTVPALGPQVAKFQDRKIPTGKYFYVVVTAAEMKPDANLVIRPGDNVTTEAMVIEKTDTPVRPVKTEKEPPAVRDLTVRAHPDQKGAAVLTWRVLGEPSATVLLRNRQPIDNEAAFRSAKRIAVLRPWARHFVDREVPRGVYYYAAYLQRELRGDLTLKKDENFTTKSYTSDYVPTKKSSDPIATTKDFAISSLLAVNGQSSVKLSWKPATAGNVVYNVYRGEFPLDSARSIRRAKPLGEVEDGTNFEDAEPLKDRRVYYGVTVTDNRTGKEYLALREGVGFRAHVFQPNVASKEFGALLPDALTTFLKDSRTVMLFWAEPDKKVQGFRVYRHDRPVDTVEHLKDAKLIGRLDGDANRFTDKSPPGGRHYYALLPMDDRGREVREFIERRTFTGFGVVVADPPKKEEPKKEEPKKEEPKKEEPKKEEPLVEPQLLALSAARDSEDIVVTWEAERDPRDKRSIIVRLYRASEPMRRLDEVRARGIFVEETTRTKGTFRDRAPGPGSYYYAALLEVDRIIQERMLLGRNFTNAPVRIEEQKKEEPPVKKEPSRTDTDRVVPEDVQMERLEGVLKRTFGRKRYAAAVVQLQPFTAEGRNSNRVRARAMFYVGLSYYRLQHYQIALEYFLNFRVRDAFPRRARFYYYRSLERMR